MARYADSNGLDENVAHGNAWRYRDYVVAAFNRDKPFDRFLTRTIRGRPAARRNRDRQRHEQLIATGFLAIGPKVLAEVDEAKMQMDIVDEQIDTVGRAFLGLTLGCARCHDHKFDPIDTADYYGLAGIFKSTRAMEHYKKVARWYEHVLPSPETDAIKAAYDARVADAKKAVDDFIAKADDQVRANLATGATIPDKLETHYPAETKAEIKSLRDALTQLTKNPPDLPAAMGVTEGLRWRMKPFMFAAVRPNWVRSLPGTRRRPFADRQRRCFPPRKAVGGSWRNGSSIRGIPSPVASS